MADKKPLLPGSSTPTQRNRRVTRRIKRVVVKFTQDFLDFIEEAGEDLAAFLEPLAKEADEFFNGRVVVVYIGSLVLDFIDDGKGDKKLREEVRDWVLPKIAKKFPQRVLPVGTADFDVAIDTIEVWFFSSLVCYHAPILPSLEIPLHRLRQRGGFAGKCYRKPSRSRHCHFE